MTESTPLTFLCLLIAICTAPTASAHTDAYGVHLWLGDGTIPLGESIALRAWLSSTTDGAPIDANEVVAYIDRWTGVGGDPDNTLRNDTEVLQIVHEHDDGESYLNPPIRWTPTEEGTYNVMIVANATIGLTSHRHVQTFWVEVVNLTNGDTGNMTVQAFTYETLEDGEVVALFVWIIGWIFFAWRDLLFPAAVATMGIIDLVAAIPGVNQRGTIAFLMVALWYEYWTTREENQKAMAREGS
jgi:hypothetical protein